MGLLDKMKNLFTEEVEEPIQKKETKNIKMEEPIKKEILKQERTVEIAPARKETAELYEKEIEEIKQPEKTISSLYFDDDDFLDLPKREEQTKSYNKNLYQNSFKNTIESSKESKKNVEKKKFKPSPIISPVYGVLDKNYKKDEISSKVTENPYKSDKLTVDDIRNKAYGTLEEELENTLINSSIVVNNEEIEDSPINIFDELENTELTDELEKQKQQIEEINEIINANVTSENKKITSRKIDNILEELDEIEELIPTKDKQEENDNTKIDESEELIEQVSNKSNEIDNNNDELEEGDLFNLIDSMYEKRDD